MIPAPRNNPDFNSHEWQDWFFQLWKNIGGGSSGGSSGMGSTTLVVNKFATVGWSPAGPYQAPYDIAKRTLSGSYTSGVEKNVLSISGKGIVSFLGITCTNGVNKTLNVRLNIDGVDAFNFTSAAGTLAPGTGLWLAGSSSAATAYSDAPLYFKTSLDVFITANATENNFIAVDQIYTLNT